MTDEERAEIEAILGHRFEQTEWLERALTHRSHRQTVGGADNERLEFLGDRILGLVASEQLYLSFPDWDAGKLSKGLARLVSGASIHAAARRLNLGAYLRLGPGEEKTGGREKQRLLADAYEAVVGAIYLDKGLEASAAFLRRTLLDPALAERGTRARSRGPQICASGVAPAAGIGRGRIPDTQRIRPRSSEDVRSRSVARWPKAFVVGRAQQENRGANSGEAGVSLP